VSRAKQSPSRKRLKKAVPALGAAAGFSLSLASGASGAPALHMPTPAGAGHEIILAEEEISDVSLATFFVYDKESTATFRPNIQLARGGCGGGCGGGGCRGCGGGGCGGYGCRGCGGCAGCSGCGGCGGFGGCGYFWPYGGCGGCLACAGCAPAWWGAAPPPPMYFYRPPPGRPPLPRLGPPHKDDEKPVETAPVSKDPAPNAASGMPAPLRAAPATPTPVTTPARPPSPPAAAPGSIQD
jgi:hypothetical protein